MKMAQYSHMPADNFAWTFDDSLLWSRQSEGDPLGLEHMFQLIEGFLSTCLKWGTILKPSKTRFFQRERKHQGFIYSLEGMRRDEAAVAPLLKIPAAQSVTEIRSFLRMMEAYSAGTPVLRLMCAALNWATKKDAWDQEETPKRVVDAMREVQEALATATLRNFPNFDQRFYWRIDAGNLGMAAVLGQRVLVNGKKEFVPIQFWSRCLHGLEPLYWASKKEAIAWAWALVDKGRIFSEYSRNVIISDAKSLEDLYNTAANTTNRVIQHALMQLQHLEIKVRIVPRVELMDVDMFPRVLHQPKDATVGQANALFCGHGIDAAPAFGAMGA